MAENDAPAIHKEGISEVEQTVCRLETASLPHGVHTPPLLIAPRVYKNLILPEYLVLLTAILHFCQFIFFAQPTFTHRLRTQEAQASSPQTSLGKLLSPGL